MRAKAAELKAILTANDSRAPPSVKRYTWDDAAGSTGDADIGKHIKLVRCHSVGFQASTNMLSVLLSYGFCSTSDLLRFCGGSNIPKGMIERRRVSLDWPRNAPPVLKVGWLDTVNAVGWNDGELQPAVCWYTGWLVKRDAKQISLATCYVPKQYKGLISESMNLVCTVPVKCVFKVERVKW